MIADVFSFLKDRLNKDLPRDGGGRPGRRPVRLREDKAAMIVFADEAARPLAEVKELTRTVVRKAS
jgi:hypothetical protein